MTSTVERPAVGVERITVQRAMALILAESKTRAYPIGINQNGPGSDILVVHWAGLAGLYQWTDFFGFTAENVRRRLSDDGSTIRATGYAWGWHGWSVQAEASEPVATADPETAALIDDVTSACRSCGGEVTHRAGCPSEPEHLVDHYAVPAKRYRSGMPGSAAVDAAMDAAAMSPECVDCGVPGGHLESCAFADRCRVDAPAPSAWTCPPCTRPGHFRAPDHTFAEGCRYEAGVFAGRMDPEAAAQIPVVEIVVTPNPAPSRDIDEVIAALVADIDEPVPYTPIDPDAREYVPAGAYDSPAAQQAIHATITANVVHFSPQGVLAANWVCGVDAYAGTTGASDPNCVTCSDCTATFALPRRIPGAALAAELADLDEPTREMPCAKVPVGVELIHIEGHAVQAPDDAFGDDEGRGGAGVARMGGVA